MLYQRECDYFILNFNNEDEETISRFIKYLNINIKIVLDFFEIRQYSKTKINIYDSRSDFLEKLNRESAPDWVVGSCPECEIEILSPTLTTKTHSFSDMLKVTIHEYVHSVIYNYISKHTSGWLEEGMCVYLSGQNESVREMIEYYDNQIMNIPEMNTQFSDIVDLGGYFYSGLIVEFLVASFGKSKVIQLLRCPDNVINIFDKDISSLNVEFKKYVNNRYLKI